MKNKLTKIQESILILCTLQALLDEYKDCLTKEKGDSKSVIFAIIGSQILLTSCSYMEEWELFGKLIDQDPKILKLRKIVKPAINRINKWNDIGMIRNSIIAHNHRIRKDNNSPVMLNIDRKLNCPNSFLDYKLLMGCIYLTKNVLLRVFSKEYNQILPNLTDIKDIMPLNEIKHENDFKLEFDNITQDVQKLLETIQ